MTRAFWLSLTFLGVYALVMGAFILGCIDQLLAGASGSIASGLLATITDSPVYTRLEDGELWIEVARVAPFPVQAALLNIYLPLYIAVVTAAARSYGPQFWVLLVAGVVLLFGIETLALAARLWAHAREALPEHWLFPVFKAFDVLSQRGLAAVPSFVGALLAWSLPAPKPRGDEPGAAEAAE